MEIHDFVARLEQCIQKYDLLCHPFYKAWSAGELTREDLREYAQDYYHHVAAFPSYLATFGIRLEDGDLRRAVLANMMDENGGEDIFGNPAKSHADLWLDFVEGMGGRTWARHSIPEITELITWFQRVSSEGTMEEALAAYYAYESQVPRIAREKDRGLRELYGVGEEACAYFTLHTTADVYHSRVWRTQLEKRITAHPDAAEKALQAAEKTAYALWKALDGVEARRQAKTAA